MDSNNQKRNHFETNIGQHIFLPNQLEVRSTELSKASSVSDGALFNIENGGTLKQLSNSVSDSMLNPLTHVFTGKVKKLIAGDFRKVVPSTSNNNEKGQVKITLNEDSNEKIRLNTRTEQIPQSSSISTGNNVELAQENDLWSSKNALASQNVIDVTNQPSINQDEIPSYIIDEIDSNQSSDDSCRICHDDESNTPLIKPCLCKGTMGVVHQRCLERWLSESGKTICEICGYKYITERRPKSTGIASIWGWIRRPIRQNDSKNLFFDLACFFVLTPLAALSAWLCVTKLKEGNDLRSGYYSDGRVRDTSGSTWTSIGLLTLTATLMAAYYVWLFVAFRYHYQIWKDWQSRNFYVKVLPAIPAEANSGTYNPNPQLSPNIPQLPQISDILNEEYTVLNVELEPTTSPKSTSTDEHGSGTSFPASNYIWSTSSSNNNFVS